MDTSHFEKFCVGEKVSILRGRFKGKFGIVAGKGNVVQKDSTGWICVKFRTSTKKTKSMWMDERCLQKIDSVVVTGLPKGHRHFNKMGLYVVMENDINGKLAFT